MNRQELIEKIYEVVPFHVNAVRRIVNQVDAEGWLRNPGTPIDPKDIGVGDRVRRVHGNGDEVVGTVEYLGGWIVGCKYFLLDRPKPEPTNAEKLKKIIWASDGPVASISLTRAEMLAKWLDEAGVKAPGGDDE